eukprot:53990-Eustigmatos_ZCMA.PRE.1
MNGAVGGSDGHCDVVEVAEVDATPHLDRFELVSEVGQVLAHLGEVLIDGRHVVGVERVARIGPLQPVADVAGSAEVFGLDHREEWVDHKGRSTLGRRAGDVDHLLHLRVRGARP